MAQNNEEGLQHTHKFLNKVMGELEMQRRAIIGLKAQRDIDRSRRLQLIMRLKKYRDKQLKFNFQLLFLTTINFLMMALIIYKGIKNV